MCLPVVARKSPCLRMRRRLMMMSRRRGRLTTHLVKTCLTVKGITVRRVVKTVMLQM